MKSIKSKLWLCFSLAILLGCTRTTTRIKKPVFADQAKFESQMTTIVKAQNLNIIGKEITKNNKISTELEVSVINGYNIPGSPSQQQELEKLIASCVKENLNSSDEFDFYKILLVTESENNGVKSRSFAGKTFPSAEL